MPQNSSQTPPKPPHDGFWVGLGRVEWWFWVGFSEFCNVFGPLGFSLPSRTQVRPTGSFGARATYGLPNSERTGGGDETKHFPVGFWVCEVVSGVVCQVYDQSWCPYHRRCLSATATAAIEREEIWCITRPKSERKSAPKVRRAVRPWERTRSAIL